MEKLKELLSLKANFLSFQDRTEWHSKRRSYIGGSDVGVVLGVNHFKTPYELWKEKVTGETDFHGNLATELGTYLEPFLREKFKKVLKQKEDVECEILELDFILESKDHYFAVANVDGIVKIGDEYSVLELKTSSDFNSSKWEDDEVPDSYYYQVQWYLEVTGLQKAYIFYLVGNRKVDYKVIPRNDEVIKAMFEKTKEFWEQFVLTKEAPGFTADDKILDIFPHSNPGETKDISDLEDDLSELEDIKEQIKELTAKKEEIENKVKAEMQTAEEGRAGAFKVTWKTTKRDGYYVQPTEFRMFRVAKPKKK